MELTTSQRTKGYAFVNRYCVGIQAGIQAAHALLRLSTSENRDDFNDWMNDSETIVCLSAASHEHLLSISETLLEFNAVEDVSVFRESALNNAVTAVAFIGSERLVQCQDKIYEWKELRKIGEGQNRRVFDSNMHHEFGDTYALAQFMNKFGTHNG